LVAEALKTFSKTKIAFGDLLEAEKNSSEFN
jgi:hypothetical protein